MTLNVRPNNLCDDFGVPRFSEVVLKKTTRVGFIGNANVEP
jgi:hypothetical protein